MNKNKNFVVTYENIEGKELELKVSASSHVQACELAESEDSDLGQIFSVCTEQEHELRKQNPGRNRTQGTGPSFNIA